MPAAIPLACRDCGTDDLLELVRSRRNKRGFETLCRACRRLRNRMYRESPYAALAAQVRQKTEAVRSRDVIAKRRWRQAIKARKPDRLFAAISEACKRWRQAKGVTQRQLATMLGYSTPGTIIYREKGRVDWTPADLRLLRRLGVEW